MSLAEIDRKYPTQLDVEHLTKEEFRKQRTIELYSYLPQANISEDMTKEEKEAEIERALTERYSFVDIRDAIVEINYAFFGYVASHTFINNSAITYEDKFQSALTHFLEMWHKYKFAAKYRTDLSFAVFFKPRVGECIERELNEVKYSLRRTLCMEVGEMVGKHWGQVKYEDLSDPRVKLKPEKMESLKAMFGTFYWADLETHALFIQSDCQYSVESELYSDEYETIQDMLIHEMIENESKLSDKKLLDLSLMLDVPFNQLKDELPVAEAKLQAYLEDVVAIQHDF